MVCRESRFRSLGIMDDAIGNIQETRQEQRPARMVGLLGLDLIQSGKDAGEDSHKRLLRQGVEL